ncbi:uncharacterized protein [Typha latifolia]|uniref:uncharacterized protein n=1 Tax=Typha latifolia TaxID=4733 RepID=UPI003C304E0A
MATLSPSHFFTTLLFFLSTSLLLFSVASAYEFRVGGPRGWTKPTGNESETYNHWAKRNRFHVGDYLHFKYVNDSVLLVSHNEYKECNTTDPILQFTGGDTSFRFDRGGLFYFISGEPGHCDSGQRMIVRVMVHPETISPALAPLSSGPSGQPWSNAAFKNNNDGYLVTVALGTGARSSTSLDSCPGTRRGRGTSTSTERSHGRDPSSTSSADLAFSSLQPRDTCYVASEGLVDLKYSGYQPHAYSWDEYPPLKDILNAVREALPGSYFNSLVLNRYKSGSDYVSWHSDDEQLYGPTPEIASVTFGCEREFLLRRRPAKSQGQSLGKRSKVSLPDQRSFVLKHGSLLVMRGYTQRDWLHSVPKRAKAASARINLTFRRVLTYRDLQASPAGEETVVGH